MIIFAGTFKYPAAKRAIFLLSQWRNFFRPCTSSGVKAEAERP
jgi:hypothetical protein